VAIVPVKAVFEHIDACPRVPRRCLGVNRQCHKEEQRRNSSLWDVYANSPEGELCDGRMSLHRLLRCVFEKLLSRMNLMEESKAEKPRATYINFDRPIPFDIDRDTLNCDRKQQTSSGEDVISRETRTRIKRGAWAFQP